MVDKVDILESIHLDVEELLEDLRLQWLEREDSRYNPSALSKIHKKGDNFMFCCPHHSEGNPSCGIKIDYPYTWNCFGCGASGNLGQLVAHTLGLPTEAHGEHYITKNYLVVSANERPPIDLESILDGTGKDRRRSLPDEEAKKFTRKRHSYITNRGFSDRTIRRYEVGYDEETQAVTFPVRTSSGLLRFIKRRFVAKKGFLNEANIDKKDIVYGLYYILQAPKPITEIYLNESETDTMACYEGKLPAGAILGRILFREQSKELVKAGIKTVNLFFDNDKAGILCTLKAYSLLSRTTPLRINVVLYPGLKYGIDTLDAEMVKYKDANDLLKARRLKDIEVVPFEKFYFKLKNGGLIEQLEEFQEMNFKL